MKKKLIKSYTLSSETVNAIVTYANVTGNSSSQTAENLILIGLENIERSENIKDEIKIELKKLEEKETKNTNRIINILMKQTRTMGKILGTTLTHAVRSKVINENEIEDILKSGINKAMNDLKYDMRKVYE